MKTAINAWSVRSDADFETAIRDVKAAGFDGIEFNVDRSGAHALTLDITDAELARIASLSEKYSLPVVSISTSLWGANMGLGTPEGFEFSKRLLNCQLRCAKLLGAGGVLIVPGGISNAIPMKQAFENCKTTLEGLKPDIEEYRINVGVENVWNGFFTSPFDMAAFIDAVDCEFVGAYYDIGNTLAFSRTQDWIDILGKRIFNTHIKGFRLNSGLNSGGQWVDISKSGIDWKPVREALDRVGFGGHITAEVSRTDPNMEWEDFYRMVCGEITDIIK